MKKYIICGRNFQRQHIYFNKNCKLQICSRNRNFSFDLDIIKCVGFSNIREISTQFVFVTLDCTFFNCVPNCYLFCVIMSENNSGTDGNRFPCTETISVIFKFFVSVTGFRYRILMHFFVSVTGFRFRK